MFLTFDTQNQVFNIPIAYINTPKTKTKRKLDVEFMNYKGNGEAKKWLKKNEDMHGENVRQPN